MSAGTATAVTVISAVLFADSGNAWLAGFLGFVAGGWFITFVDGVWP